MARKKPTRRRKIRTRGHVIADLSANHVERHALLCGFSVERIVHDYGIDLTLLTYARNGEVENGQVLLQLKATDKLNVRAGQQSISFLVARADLALWLDEPMPVILVVYDARADVAYWLYVQADFEQRGVDLGMLGNKVTVRLPTANVLNQEAMYQFARYKEHVLAQVKGRIDHDA